MKRKCAASDKQSAKKIKTSVKEKSNDPGSLNCSGGNEHTDVESAGNRRDAKVDIDEQPDCHISLSDSDPMLKHWNQSIDFDKVDAAGSQKPIPVELGERPCLWYSSRPFPNVSDDPLDDLLTFLHPKIIQNMSQEPFGSMSQRQKNVFHFLTMSYASFHDPTSNINNMPRSRIVYTLHVMNHLLKSRALVYEHNAALKLMAQNGGDPGETDFRDQGITRPKVLILTPFRESAYKIVRLLITLFAGGKKGLVANRKRFVAHFGSPGEKKAKKKQPRAVERPPDYEKIFKGDTDDCFRLGIQLGRKRMKVFSDFYSSDLIIASPLGLRMVMGGEGDKKWDIDFLSSLEMVIFDQADIFAMQNIDHVMFILDHIHLRPADSHGVDFTRVRNVWLDDQARGGRFLCQHLMFSAVPMPEISGILSQKSANLGGKLTVQYRPSVPAASHIALQLPQAFHRFVPSSISSEPDERFSYFCENVFANFADSQAMDQTMIFIPSYFDFVRVRNYLKVQEASFVQICEYTKETKVIRARDMFFNGRKKFCLYTERYHFFRRHKIKGVKHVIFYQLPMYPHYYAEICNFICQTRDAVFPTCTVVYSKYDALRLAGVLGHERAGKVLAASKPVHMVVSE